MKKVASILIVTIGLFVNSHLVARAVVDPLSVPNNKFGIHVIDENDLEDAATLVNSSGGSWGYVTIVVTEQDRDTGRWQKIFDDMRRLKLIPVLRLATIPVGDSWRSPKPEDAAEWATFLDSLNWVVQNRYIVLFNEPNHAKEWGNTIEPGEYATVAAAFHDELKSRSDDYFILPAGFDLAASNTQNTMEASLYFDRMAHENPDIFTIFDGWTSHSYPNPGFSGSVFATGKSSIRGFEWERQYLSQYGLSENIPIFITETGWVHENGQQINTSYFSAEEVGDFYETAFTDIWTDPAIVMISPFVLNYQDGPFDHFSWKKIQSDDYYDHYHRVLGLSKQAGIPKQIKSVEISTHKVPKRLLTNSLYFLPVTVSNTGQAVWDGSDKLRLHVVGALSGIKPITKSLPSLEPNQTISLSIPVKTDSTESIMQLALAVEDIHAGELVGPVANTKIIIESPPTIWQQLLQLITGARLKRLAVR